MDFKILNKVQESRERFIEIRKEIKDLEMELEWMYSRESDEVKYIMHLEKRIDALYDLAEEIDETFEQSHEQ
tara:strand:- start:8375 stop:8590 length:216 start_codon:yes stop_codon:yes gene_type:complete